MRFSSPIDLESYRDCLAGRAEPPVAVRVCAGTGCLAGGSERVFKALVEEASRVGFRGSLDFEAKCSGCHGFCEEGPIVVCRIQGREVFYRKVRPEDAGDILASLREGVVLERLLYREGRQAFESEEEIPFYAGQTRKVLARCGKVDPKSLDDYIAAGGYSALVKALGMEPQTIIDMVDRAGLRGRGGGGFPAGRKWASCRAASGKHKFVLANGDEGDPGAFMDRSLMEGDPHAVLEGMIIGAYAVGASKGFIYVRDEYPLAVENLSFAIKNAREAGLLGRRILGTSFSFDMDICRGGGAFVCGESSALMASIEGRTGEPRVKYIRSTEKGLWNCPTVLNNVETWANVPIIINEGPDVYRALGTQGSPGTKVFSLVGKVKRTGLVEVPMGTSLREIIFNIGGGMRGKGRFKAVQTGGPSGGCLPEDKLDLPVDFDRLTEEGSMMGSGGMIVMDHRTCMVDVARYFVSFLEMESCGKCVPCREGLRAMREILEDLCSGKGRAGDMDLLVSMGEALSDTALCGLGQTAANPVLSTVRYFRDEYLEHEIKGFCRAGVCRGMFSARIDQNLCVSCGACVKGCSFGAIKKLEDGKYGVTDLCEGCGACLDLCPVGAIEPSMEVNER
ncbi:NADH:ubiquinone oxidoreductase, NADH-binding (51 kD) subunit [Thermanaerovibrio velox DSM 12556]|uniref:NADH:ubiquinone oxidoreductase, NADH-binding (51 kD) subunit n=1 Tax=Thermanaerovibrio velox DSM 12556 TaxID=926567 RepID=H0UNP1_9BACT|nr:NADH-ubiquinone oxidoreductase-F iron-sulfur binding region domain-containing protein [Thermanaerovibrio velox]EHM10456.1 NADH:ubiquinone oxidoreductase, NADH-binding (51 kD) subunit [Thermanaerovibrio velox DSM 12556]